MVAPIHQKHFMGGRMTPAEFHARNAFPAHARCAGCKAPPTISVQVFWPVDEVQKRCALPPQLLTPQALAPLVVLMKGSDGRPVPFIRISKAYSCNACRSALEKTVAQATPSWAAVDWDYGPGAPVILG